MSKCVGVTDDNKAKAIKLRLVSQDLADTAETLAAAAGDRSGIEFEWMIKNHIDDLLEILDVMLCVDIISEIDIILDVYAIKTGKQYTSRTVLERFFSVKKKWAGCISDYVEWS